MGEQYFFLDSQDGKARELLEPFIAQAILQGYLTSKAFFVMGASKEGFILTEKAYAEGYDTPKRLLEMWLWKHKKQKEQEEQ